MNTNTNSEEMFIMPLNSFNLKSLLDLRVSNNLGPLWNDSCSDLIPIWSKKPTIDTKEYYEFEIKCLQNTCDEIGFVQDQCSKTVENKEYCYICDIPIPSEYMQSHNAGVKHRTCTKILSHALHRANQHMTQSISLAHTNTAAKTQSVPFSQSIAHYCDECATVINKEDKEKHEVTEEHIKAVEYGRQLLVFLALFADKVVIENNNNNNISDNKNGDTNLKCKDQRNYTLNLHKETFMKENFEEMKEPIDCDKPYKDATVDYKESFVLLKTLKGETLRIPPDNYQGFSKGVNGVQCRVCREMVVDSTAHKMEPRHVELVTAPVADRNCIRPLNDVLNHCILCNEIIGDPLAHILNNNQHNILLKQCIVPGNEMDLKEGNVATDDHYCNYCNLTVEKAQKKRHKNSLVHRLKMWNANATMHHHLKATEVLCEILCKVCNVVLDNQQECLDEHLQSFDHEMTYEALLGSNKIRKFGKCLSRCQICNIRLIDKEELHHIAGARHVAKLVKWQESVLLDSKKEHALLKLKEDEFLSDNDNSNLSDEMSADDLTGLVFERTQPNYMMELGNDDQVKCKVCDVKLENNLDVINRHLETNNHKFNYDTILNYNKLTVIESSAEYKFYCEYCKVQVKEKSEIDHINDYLHSCERDFIKQLQSLNSKMSDDKNLNSNPKEVTSANGYEEDTGNTDIKENANRNSNYCDICNINLEDNVKTHYESETHKNNLDRTFIEKPKETHYLMEVKKKTVQCKVCRVRVPNNNQNIQDHISGRNHNTTYNFLLNFNKIKKGKDSFYCEICKVNVTKTLEIDHIDTSNHMTMRSNHLITDKNLHNKKGIAVVKRDSKTEDDNKTNADKVNTVNNYYCDVCEVGVPNYPHNIKEHTSGLRHKANIDRIISNHSISLKKKNSYYCNLCKTYFSKASVMKHVHSEKHKSLLAK